jgi:putative ABC transport system permease protein
MTSQPPIWIRLATLVFRACGWLLPRGYRERFASEAEDSFTTLVTDTRTRDGSRAAMTTAAAAFADLARTSVRERTAGWGGTIGSGLSTDAVRSLRIYRREPLLAGAIAVVLAFIAGPTVAIFAVLYHLVLAPLPYADADRLVVITQQELYDNHYLRAEHVADYRKVEAFASVGGVLPRTETFALDGQPEYVQGARTTGGLLTMLGVPFVEGRDLTRDDVDVVVLSRGFAIARFGSEAAALGKRVMVRQRPMTVVGVTAFRPILPETTGLDMFHPFAAADAVNPTRRGSQAVVIAKLKPGITHANALAQSQALTTTVQTEFGEPRLAVALVPLRTATGGPLRIPLLILFAVVIAVFLIAATSLGGLVMARAASRAQDVAIRASLGASRWRVVRAWIVDGIALAVPGTALGVWVGDSVLRIVRAQLPAGRLPLPEFEPIGAMLAASLGLAMLTVALFGFAPAGLGLFNLPLASQRRMYSLAGLRQMRSQSILIAAQVAASLVLVTSAIWLSSSLWRLMSRPVGYEPANLIFVMTGSAQASQSAMAQFEMARAVTERLRSFVARPGDGVAVTSILPGGVSRFGPARIRPTDPIILERDAQSRISVSKVSGEYFRLLGIRPVAGRLFVEADEASPDSTIVVSRSFASRWFPEGALGQLVAFAKNDRREVIGIVDDPPTVVVGDEVVPQCFVPLRAANVPGAPETYVLRTSASPEAVQTEVTTLLRGTDPTSTVRAMSASEVIAPQATGQRLIYRLTIGLASIALLLAIINIYSLAAFAVVRRTREIGIRLALGATISQTMRLVMGRALGWAGVGLVIGGLLTCFVAAPVLQRQLYETSAYDPRLLALAVAAVATVAFIASWLPARRAASIDPALTLRAE